MRLFLFVLLYIVLLSILTHDYIVHLTSFFDHHIIFSLERVLLQLVFLFEFYQYMLKYKYLCKISHDSFTMPRTCFWFICWISLFDHQNLIILFFWLFCWISLMNHHNVKIPSLIFLYHFTWWYSRKWQWATAKVVLRFDYFLFFDFLFSLSHCMSLTYHYLHFFI